MEAIGSIKIFAGKSLNVPANWRLCDGTILIGSEYPELFAAIGYTYGGSGGTFAVPNLQCLVPVGAGSATINGASVNVNLAQLGGNNKATVQMQNMPAHTHVADVVQPNATVSVNSAVATQSAPISGASIAAPVSIIGRTTTDTLGFNNSASQTVLNASSVQVTPPSVTNEPAGSNFPNPFDTVPQYVAMHYIICDSHNW
jgi:microcystin-dependent protein